MHGEGEGEGDSLRIFYRDILVIVFLKRRKKKVVCAFSSLSKVSLWILYAFSKPKKALVHIELKFPYPPNP